MRIELRQAYSFHQQGKRGNQEDARWPDSDEPNSSQRFFVVCDGMGGHKGGEIASQTVCNAFRKALSKVDFTEDFTNADFSHCLNKAYDALDKKAEKTGIWEMGTTMTFAAFHGGGCTLAHIGDSRIYQIRPSAGIIYRSEDHSDVNQLTLIGNITPEDAKHHPLRNSLSRYMGPMPEDKKRHMAKVLRTTDVKAGDYFLLCTDGVLRKMTDDQIEELICSSLSNEEKMHEMARRCKDSGDNNTAYLIPVSTVEEDETAEPPVADAISNTLKFTPKWKFEEVESFPPTDYNIVKTIKNQLKRIIDRI